MLRAFAAVALGHLLLGVAFGQSKDPAPKFEVADVHVSVRSTQGIQSTQGMRTVFRAGRYELRGASMLDLIRTAFTVDPEFVMGGPSWLEYKRFDVFANNYC